MTTARTSEPFHAPSPPFLAATEGQMALLRDCFRASGFTYAELFRRSVAEEEGTGADGDSPATPAVATASLSDACGVLRSLLARGRPTPWESVRDRLPADVVRVLDDLGLIREVEGEPGAVISPVLTCPIAGLWLWCDNPAVMKPGHLLPDVVYSPLTSNTQQFMLMLPRRRCDAVLELCGGTGVAALASARLAREVVTTDITERSTAFAAFNARFNELPHAEALCGDLYDPVRGRTFDRIVAHPPYMPNFEQEYVFRDGGADGEQITRRIVASLADHLRPGGQFFCVCLATDRRDAPLEERVRGWLGASSPEFDVFVTELQSPRDPTEFYAKRAYDDIGSFAEVDARHRFFREAGITRLVYGAISLRRRTHERPVFTARRRKGPLTAGTHLAWALDWETRLLDPAFAAHIVDLRPRPSEHLRMRLTYAPRPDGFALVESTLDVSSPLAYEVDTPGWVPQFLERCAPGTLTVREHHAALVRDGIVPPDIEVERLAAAVRDLATSGVIELPGYEPPPPLIGSVEVLDEWPATAPDALAREADELG